jgi:hypothetical protein
MPQPWERQNGEPMDAFDAFGVYRDLGPTRSLTKAQRTRKNGSQTSFNEWSAKWVWVDRVLAWDSYLDAQRRQAVISEVEKMSRRHAQIAQVMQNKVIERLQTIDATKLTFTELARWMEVAVKTERLAYGLSTENIHAVYMTQDEGERLVAGVAAMLNGLIIYVPEEDRDEFRREITVGVTRLLGGATVAELGSAEEFD